MTTKPSNPIDNFVDSLVDELIAMPDEHVLEGLDSTAIQSDGNRLLKAAKEEAGRRRLAKAKAGVNAIKDRGSIDIPENISIDDARHYLAQASNDRQFTLAARNLGEMSDEDVLRLYRQILALRKEKD